jgi:predicted ATPase
MGDDSMFLGEVAKLNNRKIELKKIEKILSEVLTKQKTAKDVEVKLPLANTLYQASPYLILDLINDIISYSHHGSYEKKGSKAYNQEMMQKDLLKAQQQILEELNQDIRILLDGFEVDYIQAHGVTQRTLFSSSDGSDHIAMTIKDFIQSRAWRNDEIQSFIQDWMRKLNIGYNYAITDLDGEAFKVSIFESPEDTKGFPLADLGMGSIQLMMLLFALASSIKRNYGSVFGKPTVVIEEPEQNLHPAFQSELADILYHVNKKFGLKFIVETHSEYMIRRTQVIVAQLGAANEKELAKQNPFRVYYFPKDGTPYDMKYREDGRFAEEFGSGFFDEASNLAISLF